VSGSTWTARERSRCDNRLIRRIIIDKIIYEKINSIKILRMTVVYNFETSEHN